MRTGNTNFQITEALERYGEKNKERNMGRNKEDKNLQTEKKR